MARNLLLIVGLLIIGSAIYFSVFHVESAIPPTPAFRFVNSTDNTSSIDAENHTGTWFPSAGENMTITFFEANNTVRFTSTGGAGGSSEVFTWSADHNANSNNLLNIGYVESDNANPADAGVFRLGNLEQIGFRDPTNTQNALIYLNDANTNGRLVFENENRRFMFHTGGSGLLPNIILNSSENTNNAGVAQIAFVGFDSANNGETYGRVLAAIEDNTAANPDGSFRFDADSGGTLTQMFEVNGLTSLLNVFSGIGVQVESGNIALGTTSHGTSANNVLTILNGVPPGSSPANAVALYAEDVTASSELKVRDESGAITTLSPHGIPPLAEQAGLERKAVSDWFFVSENPYTGKGVAISYFELIRSLEAVTGKQILYEWDLDPADVRDWDTDQLAYQAIINQQRSTALQEQSFLLQQLAQFSGPLTPDEQEEKDALQKQLDNLIIPDPYIPAPRPAYFDMTEIP